MAINSVSSSSDIRSLLQQQQERPQPALNPSTEENTPVSHEERAVEISPQAEALRMKSALLRGLLDAAEVELHPIHQAVFEEAGKSEYLASIAEPDDLSAEATAGRILGGIEGYIYRAFLASHPGATADDFERFKNQVVQGFERGMGEARSILEGLSALNPELAEEIAETERLVREGLDAFFEREGRRFEEPEVS